MNLSRDNLLFFFHFENLIRIIVLLSLMIVIVTQLCESGEDLIGNSF